MRGRLFVAVALALAANGALAFKEGETLATEAKESGKCDIGEWSQWSSCSKACGAGEMQRTRKIAGPKGFCPHAQEVRACNEHPCPVDCDMSEWSAWDACTVSCDGGEQQRRRKVVSPAMHGGQCGPLTETRRCHTKPCGHAEHSIAMIPTWRRGIKCARVDFAAKFIETPHVFATINHRMVAADAVHDPADVWIETPSTTGFRVCIGNAPSTNDIQIDWFAFDREPAFATFMCDKKRVVRGEVSLKAIGQDAPVCQRVSFNHTFAAGTPQVWGGASLGPSVSAQERHPTAAWLEDIDEGGFRVCAQGVAARTPKDDAVNPKPVDVTFTWTSAAGEGVEAPQLAKRCSDKLYDVGRKAVPTWNGGPKCVTVDFSHAFDAPPAVYHSVQRGSDRQWFPEHAVSSWVERVTKKEARICIFDAAPDAPREGFLVSFVANAAGL